MNLPDRQNQLSGSAEGGSWWTLDVDSVGTETLVINENTFEHKVAALPHEAATSAVAISRQGNWIATASKDGKVFLWPWSQQGLIELTCTLIGRNLTCDERQKRHLERNLGLRADHRTCPNFPLSSE